MRKTHGFSLLTGALFLLLASPLAAQTGTLTGRVTDLETGAPVNGAQIQILGGAEGTGVLSNTEGVYRIQLEAGSYAMVVSYLGYREERVDGLRISAGGTTSQDMALVSIALQLNELVVTASRGVPEKQVDAPATTHTVGNLKISERSITTPADHIRDAPGVDVISHGLQATNVVIRGFNNIFSGALHALTDHRLAGVPSLRVNLLHFIPSTNEDIDRMEVVLGPGSALYGPNTANGVLHIFTKSPLESQGTTMTLGGGERSVFQGSFRTAFLINENFGFKVSGQYLQGDEWAYTDPGEQAARSAALASPAACEASQVLKGWSASEAALACTRVGLRDFDLKRWGMEARADYRFAEDGTAIFTYGRTSASGVELTGLGAGQTEDWIYEFYQARMNKGRFFAQAYYNTSDAGNSFLLRDGAPLIDQSSLFVAQVQHGLSILDDRQDFTYGLDYFGTRPDTKGTINGYYEDSDNMDEWGAYLQSKTVLHEKLDLIFAGRVDDHSMLPEVVFSPRAALVFKPNEDQALRATYNRAFSTPSSLNLFLDISAGAAPDASLAALGYTVRAFGTGPDGYAFQNPDGTLRGMRSPFNPGGGAQLIPADAASMWGPLLTSLPHMVTLPPELLPIVQGLAQLQPTSADIGTMVFDLNTQELTPVGSAVIPSVPGIRESYTETFEVGWQGIVGRRLRLSADVYYEKKNDFVSPLLIQTPALTMNGQDVGAYITTPVVTMLTQAFMAAGLDQATAFSMAQAQAASIIPTLAGAIAQVPVGIVSSDQVAAQGPDIIVTYRNVGDIDLWGADLGFEWFIDEGNRWTMNGTYSHVSDDYFEIDGGDPIALNAPKDKGTLGVSYRNPLKGFNAEARVRYTTQFPAESAGYEGTLCVAGAPIGVFTEDCVDAATLVDINMGYKIPNTRGTLRLAVTNLFDQDYRSFVGVPNIGRFAMISMKYDLF